MFKTLEIKNYRGLSHFKMEKLGRINLLVGGNNSGKTSILEALQLLATNGNPLALWNILSRRGEYSPPEESPSRYGRTSELEISHLFLGHEIKQGSSFSISANNKIKQELVCNIEEMKEENLSLLHPEEDDAIGIRLALYFKGNPMPSVPMVPLSKSDSLGLDTIESLLRRRVQRSNITLNNNIQYVSTESLSVAELHSRWNEIALTPNELLVLQALKFLDTKIERIAAIPAGSFSRSRGGFIVKFESSKRPVPIGSLGDGAWRMLALAIALSSAKDSILLIDEIDTGLHYSVMSSMWKMINETAKEFNIQVFATTHSLDCVNSLAYICREGVDENSEVTVQRLEPEYNKAVAYTEEDIIIAAKRHIEVR
ncbi:MAG: AAA family ATPase [Pseudomonadota bacterium]